jgi:hypothetical protein
MTTLIFDETLRTRSGETVTLVSIDGRGRQPILGYIGRSTTLSSWGRDGKFYVTGEESQDDLINPPEKIVRYVNIYRGKPGHATRAEADAESSSSRIACIRVEFLAGQYDDQY